MIYKRKEIKQKKKIIQQYQPLFHKACIFSLGGILDEILYAEKAKQLTKVTRKQI